MDNDEVDEVEPVIIEIHLADDSIIEIHDMKICESIGILGDAVQKGLNEICLDQAAPEDVKFIVENAVDFGINLKGGDFKKSDSFAVCEGLENVGRIFKVMETAKTIDARSIFTGLGIVAGDRLKDTSVPELLKVLGFKRDLPAKEAVEVRRQVEWTTYRGNDAAENV